MKRIIFLIFTAYASILSCSTKELAQTIQQNVISQKQEIIDLLVQLEQKIVTAQPAQAREMFELLREYLSLDWEAIDKQSRLNNQKGSWEDNPKIKVLEQKIKELAKSPYYADLNMNSEQRDEKIASLKAQGKKPIISINLEEVAKIDKEIAKLKTQEYDILDDLKKQKKTDPALQKMRDINSKMNKTMRTFFENVGPLDFWQKIGVDAIDEILKKMPKK